VSVRAVRRPHEAREERIVPDLNFRVEHAEMLPYAATPSLQFRLAITNTTPEPIRSVLLNTQIRIASQARHYTRGEQGALLELFGEVARWARRCGVCSGPTLR
jgi:hypothetical protein